VASREAVRAVARFPLRIAQSDPLGHAVIRKVSGGHARAYTVTESTKPVGLGAPPHDHAEHEEAFTCRRQFAFDLNGSEINASAGSFVLVPRGVTTRSRSSDLTGALSVYFSPPATPEEKTPSRLREQENKD
jgi:hypothetical protein